MTQHYATMTVKALRALAAEHGIAGRSKMKKAELVSALTTALAEPAPVVERLSTPRPPADEPGPEAEAEALPADADDGPPPAILTAADVLARRTTMPRNSGAPLAAPVEPVRHPHAGKGPLLPPLELPPMSNRYDDAFLTLLPQTPGSLVAIWSLTHAERRAFYGRTVELRLVDQTWNHQVVHRASPDGHTTRWAISGLTPDRTYRAMLGTVEGDRFVAVLWSKPLALPPEGPRPYQAERLLWSDGSEAVDAAVAPVSASCPGLGRWSSHVWAGGVTR